MTFFRDDIIPSCSICRYATEYIPSFTYPFFDPHCSKGHGKCDGEKFCEDFRLIGGYYCEDCKYLEFVGDTFNKKTYCSKKEIFVDKFQTGCAYIVKKEVV